ncbi:hypothetical protein RUND412_000515 [Rhizina undulata]
MIASPRDSNWSWSPRACLPTRAALNRAPPPGPFCSATASLACGLLFVVEALFNPVVPNLLDLFDPMLILLLSSQIKSSTIQSFSFDQ